MGALNFLLMLVIAGLIGYAASALMGARRMHILMIVALGFVGTIVGPWVANFFHLREPLPIMVGGTSFPLVWSIAGAALVVAIVSMIRNH